MYTVTYVLGTTDQRLARIFWAILMECLVRVNVQILRSYPRIDTSRIGTIKGWVPDQIRTVLQAERDREWSPDDREAFEVARRRVAGDTGARYVGGLPAWIRIPERIRFRTGAFRGDHERDLSNRILAELLEALVQIDVVCFREDPSLPGVYASGVYYKREPRGEEFWLSVLALYRQGFGDCEDLASALTAEKRVREGRPVRAGFTWRKRSNGGTLYHIIQENEAGALEDDPSARLGMLEKER